MVQPRRYKRHQIEFILMRVGAMKNDDIVSQYNREFPEPENQITAKQLKYIRLTYGSDPNFGAPLYNRIQKVGARNAGGRPAPASFSSAASAADCTSSRTTQTDHPPAQLAAPSSDAAQPSVGPRAREGCPYPEPPGWGAFAYSDDEFLRRLRRAPSPAHGPGGGCSPRQEPRPRPRAHSGRRQPGFEHGPHDRCRISGQHRHAADGGVFQNLAAVADTWERLGQGAAGPRPPPAGASADPVAAAHLRLFQATHRLGARGPPPAAQAPGPGASLGVYAPPTGWPATVRGPGGRDASVATVADGAARRIDAFGGAPAGPVWFGYPSPPPRSPGAPSTSVQCLGPAPAPLPAEVMGPSAAHCRPAGGGRRSSPGQQRPRW